MNKREIDILRRLGERIAVIGTLPVMEERRRLYKKLNALQGERPMLLAEMSGIIEEIVPKRSLLCEDEWARGIEQGLRSKIFHFEKVGDDIVIDPRITFSYTIKQGDFGVPLKKKVTTGRETIGSYHIVPPITDIDESFKKLHYRSLEVDKEASEKNISALHEVFGDIIKVEHRGWYFWTQGLTIDVIDLIGMEGLLYAMVDQQEALHRLMGFMREERIHFLDWHEKNGLLFSNNQDDYIGSGGGGYTDLLDSKTLPGKLNEMWGLAESQETVGVSPEHFEEFVFHYQVPVISKFGLSCYGCCEPVENRFHYIKTLKNLRRVSVSPWSNQEKMAQLLENNYVFSRKPSPTLVSTDYFNEEEIRQDIRKTLNITKGMNVELVLKDVHTTNKQPSRLSRWMSIAREEIEKIY